MGSLVDVKPQRLQLLLLCGGDHLLHLRQLLGFGAAGLQRGQDGLNALGLLQQTPGSQEGNLAVRKKKTTACIIIWFTLAHLLSLDSNRRLSMRLATV